MSEPLGSSRRGKVELAEVEAPRRFRECLEPCERTRPILCLKPAEMDRIAQLARVDGVSWSEEIQAIIRDWLYEDLAQLAEMEHHSYPKPDRFGIGFGEQSS